MDERFEKVRKCLQSALESECPKPLIELAIQKLGLAAQPGLSEGQWRDHEIEVQLLRSRLRTIELASVFGPGNGEVAKRLAELENINDQARQYIQNARDREHRINELEAAIAASQASPATQPTCYCVCHSPTSSRPACVHCHPELFTEKADPYCGLKAEDLPRATPHLTFEQVQESVLAVRGVPALVGDAAIEELDEALERPLARRAASAAKLERCVMAAKAV